MQRSRLVVVLSCFIACSSALGQGPAPRPEPLQPPFTPPPPPPERLELRVLRAPRPSLVLPAPVQVDAFRITGASVRSDAVLRELLAPWAGRRLSAADLDAAAEAATARLRRDGLILAQAYFPAQEIRDGIAELAVVEGFIGAVALELAPEARLRAETAERFLRPLQAGAPLRSDNVERQLLLLNDLPGVRVAASVSAGVEPGSADVRASVSPDGGPVSGSVGLDNWGVREFGEYRTDVNLRLRSPLGLGDLFAARLLASEGGGQTVGTLTYGLPVNGLGTRVGVRHSEQRYKLGGDFAVLESHGESRATSLLAGHPLVRQHDRNLGVLLSYTELKFRDRQDAFGFESDSSQRIVGLGLNGDLQDAWLNGGVTSVQIQYLSGQASLDTPALAEFDAGPFGLHIAGSFSALRWRVQRSQALAARSSVHVLLAGQTASRNLDPSAEMVLAGPEAVRAYPAGELYVDEGYLARLEYRHGFVFWDNSETTFSVFADAASGRVNRNSLPFQGENRRSLSGYGVGFHQSVARSLSFQASLAWRGEDRPVTGPDRSPRVWVAAAWYMQ